MIGNNDYAADITRAILRGWYLALLLVGGLLVAVCLVGELVGWPVNLTLVWVSYLFIYVFLAHTRLCNHVT